MTSMPASRSARAMILAPRSCPSSPGLATTTRIFFSVAGGIEAAGILKNWSFAVAAEHGLQSADHLALGHFRTRRLDQQRHQVLTGIARRLGQRLERPSRGIGIPALPDRLDSLHLLGLEGRI